MTIENIKSFVKRVVLVDTPNTAEIRLFIASDLNCLGKDELIALHISLLKIPPKKLADFLILRTFADRVREKVMQNPSDALSFTLINQLELISGIANPSDLNRTDARMVIERIAKLTGTNLQFNGYGMVCSPEVINLLENKLAEALAVIHEKEQGIESLFQEGEQKFEVPDAAPRR